MQKTQRTFTRGRTSAFLATVLPTTVALLGITGCGDKIESGGPDIAYLATNIDAPVPSGEAGQSFLPLAVGNVWEMKSASEGKQNRDRLVVTKKISDQAGMQVEIQRGGRMWRREIVRSDEKGVWLSGMQDETSPLMELSPPLSLLKYPVKEGDGQKWEGTFKMGKDSFPAYGYSRISAREDAVTPAGKFKVARVDTVIVVTRKGGELRFPMVRWLAPRVGYVRRGYAEKSKPAFAELTKFN
jgi:hypothetical protein